MGKAANAEPVQGIIPDVVPGRILHVDGDYLVYWAAIGGPEMVGICRRNLIRRVESMLTMSGAERAIVHLTDRNSHKGWRRIVSVTQPYQEQRKGTSKPQNWDAVRTWLESYSGPEFYVKTWLDREADDAVAYASAKNGWDKTVMCTKDKDFRMIPGLHLVWDTFELVEVKPDDFEVIHGELVYGRKWFWLQMLMGDNADYIPGLPGVGKKRAEDMLCLSTPETAAADVLSYYRQYFPATAYQRYAEVATLLWMRHDPKASIYSAMTPMILLSREDSNTLRLEFDMMHERIQAHAQEVDRIASEARAMPAISAAELCRSLDW